MATSAEESTIIKLAYARRTERLFRSRLPGPSRPIRNISSPPIGLDSRSFQGRYVNSDLMKEMFLEYSASN
jgi:hypothetical protein